MLQSIAAENNLAETAFVVQCASTFDLRWFTPAIEIDLCGHATLGSAHVIFHLLGYRSPMVRFQTRSGELTVSRSGELLTLDLPSRPAVPCIVPRELTEGLGRPAIFTAKARDYLVVFDSEKTVRNLRPDMAVLARLDALGVIATAPGEKSDFVSRFFGPRAGIPEDPVTGSAHCTLIPYWADRLKRVELHAFQVSARGGELFCEDRGGARSHRRPGCDLFFRLYSFFRSPGDSTLGMKFSFTFVLAFPGPRTAETAPWQRQRLSHYR